MIKKITFIFTLFISLSIFSQEQKGDRAGTIFYSTVDKTETNFSLYIDLFEPAITKYIEAELYNDSDVKLASILVELIKEDKSYYIFNEEKDSKIKVNHQDINLILEKNTSSINYPRIRIKLLDSNYSVIDFSQKNFY